MDTPVTYRALTFVAWIPRLSNRSGSEDPPFVKSYCNVHCAANELPLHCFDELFGNTAISVGARLVCLAIGSLVWHKTIYPVKGTVLSAVLKRLVFLTRVHQVTDPQCFVAAIFGPEQF